MNPYYTLASEKLAKVRNHGKHFSYSRAQPSFNQSWSQNENMYSIPHITHQVQGLKHYHFHVVHCNGRKYKPEGLNVHEGGIIQVWESKGLNKPTIKDPTCQ